MALYSQHDMDPVAQLKQLGEPTPQSTAEGAAAAVEGGTALPPARRPRVSATEAELWSFTDSCILTVLRA